MQESSSILTFTKWGLLVHVRYNGRQHLCLLVLQNSSQPQGRHYAHLRETVQATLNIRGVFTKSNP